ncbi:CHAT domain-containing protein [Lasiosphaeria ovina]|uniref:CHAT domain-containing protein n=1 Tax=Lasiosphaeria ovina TaxID=92902 RepID=A0AAE0NDH5_9PEZI|nr:CHAT domain-containing protein [Lasiosphaeria ovina]
MDDLDTAIQAARLRVDATPEDHADRAQQLGHLGMLLADRYFYETDSMADLDDAIQFQRQSINLTLKDLRRPKDLSDLGSLLFHRYQITGKLANLDEAIRLETDQAMYWNGLGNLFYARAQSMADLEEAVRMSRRAVDMLPNDHPDRPEWLNNLAVRYLDYSSDTGATSDLEKAVLVAEEALNVTPGTPSPVVLNVYGRLLGNRYMQTGVTSDIEEAIQRARQALDIASDNPGPYLVDLAMLLLDLYHSTGAIADLEQVIQVARQAAKEAENNRLRRLKCSDFLGHVLFDRYKKIGTMADLDDIFSDGQREISGRTLRGLLIDFWCQSTGAMADYAKASEAAMKPAHILIWDLTQVGCLTNLRIRLYDRYKKLGDIADLKRCIQVTRHIADMAPNDLNRRDLGSRLHDLYSETLDEAALNEATDIARQLAEGALNGPDRAVNLHNLADSLSCHYQITGDTAELDKAIEIGLQSQAVYLDSLGGSYYRKYCATMMVSDLDEAIRRGREAVDTMLQGDSNLAKFRSNLSYGLLQRYYATSSAADLNESIRLGRQAVDAAAGGYQNQEIVLDRLATALYERYTRMATLADLEEATRLGREAVDLAPREPAQDHQQKPRYLSNLVLALSNRFGATKSMADVERALQLGREALEMAQSNHLDLPCIRFHETRQPGDLKEAIQLGRRAVDSSPIDHPGRLLYVAVLAIGLHGRYSVTGRLADLYESIRLGLEALDLSTRSRTGSCLLRQKWQQAWLVASSAIPLIQSYTPRFLENLESQTLLSRVSGLASDAAAVALSFGREPIDAIEFLEAGRGMPAHFLNELRTDMSLFARHEPKLGKEFLDLRDQLEAAQAGSHAPQLPLSRDREEDRPALRELTRHIAASSGLDKFIFERLSLFRSVPDDADMDHIIKRGGPIVLINVSYRCDAFLIQRDYPIRVLPLSRLSREEIEERTKQGNLGSPQVLEWLWDIVAGPVLRALGLTQPPPSDGDDDWPRVRWIPVGALSRFPLHAAGRHDRRSNEAVIDRVMSSYSPSIGAIMQGMKLRRESTVAKALLVAMEHTPGSTNLPFATKEVAMLRTHFGESTSIQPIELARRCTEEVLSHLRDCDIFHFAGHGYTDPNNPLRSHLRLEDWQANPLEVADLLAINLRERPPFLAYLSACGTGKIDNEKHLDQNIHLISACQLAGFRNVIGTLWEVNDGICVDVARITYQGIRDGGMTDMSVCRALHRASRELRDRWLGGASAPPSPGKATDKNRLPTAELEKHALTVNGRGTAAGGGGRGQGEGEAESAVRLPRDVIGWDEDDEMEPAHWVPYVHFGA